MFKRQLDDRTATTLLNHITGFVRIIEFFHLTPSALVQVEPRFLESFVAQATDTTFVAFANFCMRVEPAGFERHTSSSSQIRGLDSRPLHYYYPSNRRSRYPGVGIQIAVVDSGISDHHALPAPHMAGALAQWPQWLCGSSRIHQVIAELLREETQLGIISSGTAWERYRALCDQRKIALMGDISVTEGDVWHDLLGNDPAKLHSILLANNARVPLRHAFWGSCRRISPNSANLIDSSPTSDVADSGNGGQAGHGTQMAGILSALPPAVAMEEMVKSQLQIGHINPILRHWIDYLTIEVHGFVPYAELLILKSYDSSTQRGDVASLARALEYACQHGADIVLCSLTVSASQVARAGGFGVARHLERTIEELRRRNVAVVTAAGNDGATSSLTLPASCPSAISVGGIRLDSAMSLHWDPITNLPGSHEELHFLAVSNYDGAGVPTTGLNCSYDLIHGTSASAAVACGILARAMSEHYESYLNSDYVRWAHVELKPSRGSRQNTPHRPHWDDILDTAKRTSTTTMTAPSGLSIPVLKSFTLQ